MMSQNRVFSVLERAATCTLVSARCNEIPVNLDQLARHLGVTRIDRREMSAEAFIEPLNDGGFLLALRADRSEQRQRFSIAHELGHLLVHKLGGMPDSSL